MKYILAVLLNICIALPLQAIENDKLYHITVSYVLTTVGYGIGRWIGLSKDASTILSSIGTLAIGIGKEVYDSKHITGFDKKDLAADTIGIGLGVLTIRIAL